MHLRVPDSNSQLMKEYPPDEESQKKIHTKEKPSKLPRRNPTNVKRDWKVYSLVGGRYSLDTVQEEVVVFGDSPPFTSAVPGYSRQVSKVSRHVLFPFLEGTRMMKYLCIILDTSLMVGAIASTTRPISKVSFILMILGTIVSLEYVNPILLNRSSLPRLLVRREALLSLLPRPLFRRLQDLLRPRILLLERPRFSVGNSGSFSVSFFSVVSVAGEPSVPMVPQSGAGDPDSGLNESRDTY